MPHLGMGELIIITLAVGTLLLLHHLWESYPRR